MVRSPYKLNNYQGNAIYTGGNLAGQNSAEWGTGCRRTSRIMNPPARLYRHHEVQPKIQVNYQVISVQYIIKMGRILLFRGWFLRVLFSRGNLYFIEQPHSDWLGPAPPHYRAPHQHYHQHQGRPVMASGWSES